MKNVWKDIKDYEGLYKINQIGEVWSYPRTWYSGRNYRQKDSHDGKYISQHLDKYGYLKVALTKDGKTRTIPVHRLVAQTFIDNPENKETINHINLDKIDNRVDNLEWMTSAENNIHAWENGVFDNNNIHTKKRTRIWKEDQEHIFESVSEASRFINCDTSDLSKVARGIRNHVFGWKAEYI